MAERFDEFDELDDIDFTPKSRREESEAPTEAGDAAEPPPAREREEPEVEQEGAIDDGADSEELPEEVAAEPGRPPSVELGSQEMEQPPDLARFESAGAATAPAPPEIAAGDAAVEAEAPAPAVPFSGRVIGFFRNETTRRVLVAVPAAILVVVLIALGGPIFAAAMIGFAFLGLREFFTMTAESMPIRGPAYLTAAGMITAAYFGDSFNVLMALVIGFPLMFIVAARRSDHTDVTFSIAISLLGYAWLGTAFAHAVLLEGLPTHGPALLIDVLVATFVGDTCAYGAGRLFGGRFFGARKLAPQISPNKTYEGLIGGVLGGTLAFWFAGLYQDWLPGLDALAMGAVIACLAPIGDLFASMLKRDWDTKDTGGLFGPHGGLIDRVDAASFTIVAGYYLAVAFVY